MSSPVFVLPDPTAVGDDAWSSAVFLIPPPGPVSPGDPLLTHRDESWRVNLLTQSEAAAGTLDGVTGGRLDFSVHDTIRSGGSLEVTGPGVATDWLNVRIQPWYVLTTPDGEVSWPLGVFLPAAPKTRHTDTGRLVAVELYDKLLILDQDKIETTYTVDAAAVVTDTVRDLITSTGETKVALADSAETLTAPMVWEAGTSKLRIVNDLLAAVNYFAVWVDGWGRFRADPYVRPSARGVRWSFVDGASGIYSPDFAEDRDGFAVPNKVLLVSRTDGASEALTSVSTNTDPGSAWSQPSRGRWVVHVETDVEATSQAVLDGIAARRLAELSQVSAVLEIQHAPIPLDLNDAVGFRRSTVGLEVLAVVQRMSVDMATGALVSTTLKGVSPS